MERSRASSYEPAGNDVTPTGPGPDPSAVSGPRRVSDGAAGVSHDVRATGQGYQMPLGQSSVRSESVASKGPPVSAGRPPSSVGGKSGLEAEESGALVTARFKHIVTEEGHAVITGRDGETLQRCEDEPIHIPGAIQSFGLLIALEEASEGKLVVRVVSENSKQILGYTPMQLFALGSFTDILSEEQSDNLLDHVDFIKDETASVEASGPEVFTISIRNQQRRAQKLWCAMHVSPNNPGLLICEFELEDDQANPLVPANDHTPEPPEDTLSSAPTEEELRDSTESKSKPLRVLRSARKRKGEAATMEVFNIMSQVQEQLAEAPNLDEFLKVLVGVVKELSGFHRVMVYQFDSSWNGRVVTELVDPRATKDLYKGLNFPASDIPKQARDLYKINRVRLLYDRDQETSRLVCRTVEDLENPLDLTHSYLRAMSPIHIKYLANMAVRSSMSISINAFDELWGLISCHTYGAKGTRVSFPIRKMCRLVGDSASRNIERLSYASRLQARKLINTAPTRKNPSGYIIASSDDLLSLFNADFGLLSIHDETKVLGKLEATQEALAMLEYLRMRKFPSVTSTQDVRTHFPDLRYPPGFQVIAGLLYVPLSPGGNDFIVFFRKGQLKEVRWAGNPYEKYVREGTEGYLEPRKSFKTWSETVVGKCREWTEEETETAAVLCLVYGKFIEVWRQKEAAMQSSQLTRLLLANSAHEVRTPLNAIINYLEIAMEGALDSETRDNLSKSHSASKSLIYTINDLLDLTKTEAGSNLIREEAFDLKSTFFEAVDVFRGDADRKEISFEVLEQPGLPDSVLGDQRKVRQAITNVVANAIEATTKGGVKIEITPVDRWEGHCDVEIAVEDTGVGMNSAKLDSLFGELEQAQTEANVTVDETGPTSPTMSITDGRESKEGRDEKKTLGLGLAVVARIVRNMDGQLRVKSEEGQGSRFVIQFPFDLPDSDKSPQIPTEPPRTPRKDTTQNESGTQSELLLVQKQTPARTSAEEEEIPSQSRRGSTQSMHSGKSQVSLRSVRSRSSMQSGKSDVDKMIEAISEPHPPDTSSPRDDRPRSRRSTHRPRSSQQQRSSMGQLSAASAPQSPGSDIPIANRTMEQLRATGMGMTPGQMQVTDSSQPIKPVRVQGDEAEEGKVAAFKPIRSTEDMTQKPLEEMKKPEDGKFSVLVAEDDPINSKIVQKRMQKLGHETYLTVNGEECSSAYGERPGVFDVVLMDMQVS